MSKHHAALHAGRWSNVRQRVFGRDGWRCTICGISGPLEAHHDPPLTGGADPYDPAGIVTLCRGCHIRLHRDARVGPERRAWRAYMDDVRK